MKPTMPGFAALAITLFGLTASLPSAAQDAQSPWTKAGPVEARLVSSVRATGDLAALPLGLELRMDPGGRPIGGPPVTPDSRRA